jgi:DNA-binding NtrC family response regulator
VTERVLIVEDEILIANDLQDLLHRLGYRTSGIASNFDGARLLAPYSDIALVDVNLTDGATGPRIAQYLAEEFGISVVIVTGNPEAVEKGLSKVIGVLSKPVSQTTVQKLVEFLKSLRGGIPAIPPAELLLFSQDGNT